VNDTANQCSISNRVQCVQCLSSADGESPGPVYATDFVRFAIADSRNSPGLFLCKANASKSPLPYWVKVEEKGQCFHASELIAGRLGELTSLAPLASIVQVLDEAITGRSDLRRFSGTGVGVRDVPRSQNGRDLAHFVQNNSFNADMLDHASWTKAIVFQAWIGMSDHQGLVCLDTGRVCSIDHEESVARPCGVVPTVTEFTILGASVRKQEHEAAAMDAVTRIEAVSDVNLLRVVSMASLGLPWQPDASMRIQIVARLAARRDNLRKGIETWLLT
jgi:hypothetical protein